MFIYYQILGLDEDAGDEEIRARYLELVKVFTPEKSPEHFMRITRAYEGIRDRHSRIKSKIIGLKKYRFWTDALDDLTAGIPVESKMPGLQDLIKAENHE